MSKIAATILFLICRFAALAAAPAVTKVEPPDWPVEQASLTLRILVAGENLSGAA